MIEILKITAAIIISQLLLGINWGEILKRLNISNNGNGDLCLWKGEKYCSKLVCKILPYYLNPFRT